jgi:hypothetical protein
MTLPADPEGDWLPAAPHPWPPPTHTALDAAADAVMREIPHISQIEAHRAAQAAITGFHRFIVEGGK